MKKLLILLLFVLNFSIPFYTYSACNISTEEVNNIGASLDTCLSDSNLVNGTDATIENGLKDITSQWVKNISIVLGLIAVGSIVYGSLLMTLSTGEDEKIKKAKDIIKWGILGFVGLLFASSIILLVVNIMYSLEV